MTDTEQFEASLSFIYIDEQSNKVAINAEDKWSKKLPKMFKVQDVKDAVYTLCANHGIGYGSEDTVTNAVKEAINSYFNRRKKQAKSATGGGDDKPCLPSVNVYKYTCNNQLNEAVIVSGKPYFASYVDGKLDLAEEIVESTRKVVPSDNNAAEPYTFASKEELEQYINAAHNTDLDRLFKAVYWFVNVFNETDTDNKTILTADIIFSYFQDLLPTTHYLLPVGKPGSGKNSMMTTYGGIAYRVVAVSSVTAPNIFNALGTVEDGQITITIDEANNLDEQPEIMEVLKTGYKAGGRVPRILDASSKTREQVFYRTYAFKMVAAEHEMSPYKAEGLLSRAFVLRCFAGKPKYIVDKLEKTGREHTYEQLKDEIASLRKTLFAYRLVHHCDPIPDLRLNLEGREDEICAPLIRLFQKAVVVETIKTTLSNFIREKRQAKADGIECEVYRCVKDLVDNQKSKDRQEVELESIVLWDTLKQRLLGEDVQDKPLSMMTKAFGEVSRFTMASILKTRLGAKPVRIGNGQSRGFSFERVKLDRAAAAYDAVEIKILPSHESDGVDALDGYPRATRLASDGVDDST